MVLTKTFTTETQDTLTGEKDAQARFRENELSTEYARTDQDD